MRMVERALVLGSAGSMGQRRVRALLGLDVEVAGLDPKLSDTVQLDVAPAASLRAAVDLQPDVVFVCTPARRHMLDAALLLAAGYRGPLFVEKPLALTPAECEVFRAWPSPVQHVGYNWRWHAGLQEALQSATRRVDFTCWTDMATWPGAGYGPPLLECSHEIDQALRLGADLVAAHQVGGGLRLHFAGPVLQVAIDLRWAWPETRRTVQIDGRQVCRLDLETALEQSYVDETVAFFADPEDRVPFRHGAAVVELCAPYTGLP